MNRKQMIGALWKGSGIWAISYGLILMLIAIIRELTWKHGFIGVMYSLCGLLIYVLGDINEN